MAQRLPSVNQVIAEATAQAKAVQAQEKTAGVQASLFTTPLAAELQKVAAACREEEVVTLDDVREFAQRLQGGSHGQ